MNIETVAISTLILDPNNARKHSAKNLEAIKGSLAKFGQQKPIVVGKNNIVYAGNGTLEAAKALGWEAIEIHRTELTGAEAMAFALADNRTAELAEWDSFILDQTLENLANDNWDLESIGFSFTELNVDIDGGSQNFSEGDQFQEKANQSIEIKIPIDVWENERFRNDLSSICGKWSIDYRVRA